MTDSYCTMNRLAPQTGTAFEMKRGQLLHVVDPLGEQVSDLFAFARGNTACALSSGRSIDYAGRIYLTTGDILYANDSQPMFTIVEDSVGRHDFLLTPCSQRMFEILYQHHGHHPSCFQNLQESLARFGVEPGQIGTTFNIFKNVTIDAEGQGGCLHPPLAGRRPARAARGDGPVVRPDGLLGRRLEQRQLQADRLRSDRLN